MDLKLRDDILRGVPAIADYIGEDERRTYYLLARGFIPGKKQGAKWISRKSALDRSHSIDADPAAAA